MEMLLRRDWRTKVVGETDGPVALSSLLKEAQAHRLQIDLVLIDTDIPFENNWLSDVMNSLLKYVPKAIVMFIGVKANIQIARLQSKTNFAGYILKGEIRYALAWAVSLATEHHKIITPGVCDLFEKNNPLPLGTLILDGRNSVTGFTPHDAEAARLAFLFSMERRDLADELDISEDYSYGLVSSLYDKMGLNDILKGEADPEQYFGNHPSVRGHLKQIFDALQTGEAEQVISKNRRSKKSKDKETLAFHLLTLPSIEKISL
jgi:DNA-binding NarL/FixJ family response regulator